MIKQYDCTNGGYQHWAGCYQMSEREYGEYLHVDDVKKELLTIVFNNFTVEEYQSALNKLIEELK